jgi:hypothetical protein
MTFIAVHVMNDNVPINGLADPPEITIRRNDTGAAVVSGSTMADRASDGLYTLSFTPVSGLDYSFLIDADPNVTSQVTAQERYYDGAVDNEQNDLWRDHGLDPSRVKTITENTPGEDYTEDVVAPTAINKRITKVGAVTTIDRT